jgi:eukaryotic-like serine/threonine-protein kinase
LVFSLVNISSGTRIGRYEIRSQLGAGGMGEVYRAYDPKINREVAIKVLPTAFSADKDRLARFEQEAQAAGALNHPNIVSIYDVDTHDGSPYVVSELLQGETLRDRMIGVALPSHKCLEYALQIVKGLATAHEKGIVHRDLKPENIFITRDGRVKLLDFGLAKLIEPSSDSESRPDAPTRKIQTNSRTIMGTIGYMSPEQVRGRVVDHRSDIFSFGAVFYEMLSGKRAFQGESDVETLSAILKDDPPEFSLTNRNVAPAFEPVVRHCLEKNPEERFQSARDLAFSLQTLSGTSGAPALSTSDLIVTPARRRRRVWPILAGAVIIVFAAIATIAFVVGKRAAGTAQPLYRKLTFRHGTIWSARFAPDGQTIVYSAAWNGKPLEIFTTRPESTESHSLGLEDADVLSVSSNGEMAVLLNRRFQYHLISRGTLARVPLVGGAPRELLEDVDQADWSPDGANLAVVHWVEGRCRLEYPIGKVLYETSGYISHPRISPRGDLIAFMDHQVQGDDRGWVAVIDRSGKKKTLTAEQVAEEGLAWMPSGEEVWFGAVKAGEDMAVYAVTLAGQERVVSRGPTAMLFQDISRDGRLLVVSAVGQNNVICLPPGQSKERDLSSLDNMYVQSFSADGKIFIFSYYGQGSGPNYSTYLQKTDGSPAVRLGEGAAAALSPDGRRVLAVLNQPPQLVLLPTGAGEMKRVERGGIEYYQRANLLPDGKRILFIGRELGHGLRYYIQEIDGAQPRAISSEGVTSSTLPISPDGKFFIGTDAMQKKMIFSIEGGEPRSIAGLENGDAIIRWDNEGRSLFVVQGTLPARVFRLDPATGSRELWKEIMPADPAGLVGPIGMLLTPDGKGYLYQLTRQLNDLYLVEGMK